MIAVHGATVAHLGGWRGDRLSLSSGGGPFRALADLGFDAAAQAAPQRRLLLRGDDLFVLEPVNGMLLLPPYRVRRFDLEGRERGREEGADGGGAWLAYTARRQAPGRWRIFRSGVDPDRGRPLAAEEELEAELTGRREECSGLPLLQAEVAWYPVRMGGLFGARPGAAVRVLPCDPGPPQVVGGRLCAAANRRGRPGLYVDGSWRALAGPRLFADWKAPPGPLVLPWGEGGLLVLRREGGPLPVVEGPPARLPPGFYSALVEIDGRPFAVAEGEEPRLVPVGL